MDLRPVKWICFKVPNLNGTVLTTCHDRLSLVIIRASENSSFEPFRILSFNGVLWWQILIDSVELWIYVPLSHRTIYGRSYEKFFSFRMELTTGDTCNMPFCVGHILNVHISSYSGFEFLPISAVNPSLVVSTATEKHACLCITRETKRPQRMPIKWSELFIRHQWLVHCVHVPNFDYIIATAACQ